MLFAASICRFVRYPCNTGLVERILKSAGEIDTKVSNKVCSWTMSSFLWRSMARVGGVRGGPKNPQHLVGKEYGSG